MVGTEANQSHAGLTMDTLDMAMPVAIYSPFWTPYFEMHAGTGTGKATTALNDDDVIIDPMLRSTSAPDLLGGGGANGGISSKESWSPSPSDSTSCLDGLVLSMENTTTTISSSNTNTSIRIGTTVSTATGTSSLLSVLSPGPMSSPNPLPTVESDHRLCANCQTKQTPFWRRAGDGQFYCNACGLYLRAHNRMRPVALQATRQSKRIKNRVDSCSNCQAKDTPLWRRLNTGETVCNACGLYYKLHGSHRPVYAVKTTTTAGLGRRPRIILPKYLHGETSWHQYLPPSSSSPTSSSPAATTAAAAAAAANLMMMNNMMAGSMPISGAAAATALLGSFALSPTTGSAEGSNLSSSRSGQYRHPSLFKSPTEIDPPQLLLSAHAEGSSFMLASSAGKAASARGDGPSSNGRNSTGGTGPLLYDGNAGRTSISTTSSFLPVYSAVGCSASTSSVILDESGANTDGIRVGAGTQVSSHQHHSHQHHSQRSCQQHQCRQQPSQSHLLDYSLTWFHK